MTWRQSTLSVDVCSAGLGVYRCCGLPWLGVYVCNDRVFVFFMENRMFEDIFPNLDNLVSQLFTLLQVNHLDDIIPALRRLMLGAPPVTVEGNLDRESEKSEISSFLSVSDAAYSHEL